MRFVIGRSWSTVWIRGTDLAREGGGRMALGSGDIHEGGAQPPSSDWTRTLWLVVARASSIGAFEVTDPQRDGDLIGTWDGYGRLLEWMGDNEYRPIEGRWVVRD